MDASIFEILVVTDGRACKFCGCFDHEEDLVDKALKVVRSDGKPMTMAWFTGVPKHGQKNEGHICFYCYAVFNSRYKHRKLSTTKVREMIGADAEENKLFMKRRAGCVHCCVGHGGAVLSFQLG